MRFGSSSEGDGGNGWNGCGLEAVAKAMEVMAGGCEMEGAGMEGVGDGGCEMETAAMETAAMAATMEAAANGSSSDGEKAKRC